MKDEMKAREELAPESSWMVVGRKRDRKGGQGDSCAPKSINLESQGKLMA